MEYAKVKDFVLNWLRTSLPQGLYYHGLHHTEDVLGAAEQLCRLEGLSDEETTLVKTAALFHDTGFIYEIKANEPIGARLARERLPEYGYSAAQIERIEGMILATAVPQRPNNHLEEIICDADLDYLGREDFYQIAHTLRQEWAAHGNPVDLRTWYEQQLKFVSVHRYFTKSAQELRSRNKMAYIQEMSHLLGVPEPKVEMSNK